MSCFIGYKMHMAEQSLKNGRICLSIVVAVDENGLIGRDNGLPWYLPADLKHFKRITMGKPIIMGRKTYESIGRVLPGRTNIIVSRNSDYDVDGAVVVGSVDEAIEAAGDVDEVMLIGGATLYEQSLNRVDRIYLTRIHAVLEGDTWFPRLPDDQWVTVGQESHDPDAKNPYGFSFLILERSSVCGKNR